MAAAEADATDGRADRLRPEEIADVLQSSPDLIRIADAKGTVLHASGASVELLGCASSEMEGRPVTASGRRDDSDVLVRAVRQSLGTEGPVRRVHLARRRNGGYRWLETTVRGLNTKHGRLALLISRAVPTRATAPQALAGLPPTADAGASDWEIPDEAQARTSLSYLTDRELQVLRGLARGASVRELARRLGVRESTVRGHVKAILQKLQVHTQLQAVLVALRADEARR